MKLNAKLKALQTLIASGGATEEDFEGFEPKAVADLKSETPLLLRGNVFKPSSVWVPPEGSSAKSWDELVAQKDVDLNDPANRVVRYIASTDAKDRYGDRIHPRGGQRSDGHVTGRGWQLKNWLASPVFLWCHESWKPPIARGVRASIEAIDDGRGGTMEALILDVRYFTADENPAAEVPFRLAASGGMRGNSVGFLTLVAYRPTNEEEREALGLGKYGLDILEAELLEDSACSVPANPTALGGEKDLGAYARELEQRGLITKAQCSDFVAEYAVSESDLAEQLQERLRKFADVRNLRLEERAAEGEEPAEKPEATEETAPEAPEEPQAEGAEASSEGPAELEAEKSTAASLVPGPPKLHVPPASMVLAVPRGFTSEDADQLGQAAAEADILVLTVPTSGSEVRVLATRGFDQSDGPRQAKTPAGERARSALKSLRTQLDAGDDLANAEQEKLATAQNALEELFDELGDARDVLGQILDLLEGSAQDPETELSAPAASGNAKHAPEGSRGGGSPPSSRADAEQGTPETPAPPNPVNNAHQAVESFAATMKGLRD